MKSSGKYMAQKQGLFGLHIGYGDTIKKALKKAEISKFEDQYGLFTVKNNEIVRIKKNGQNY